MLALGGLLGASVVSVKRGENVVRPCGLLYGG